MRFVSAPGLVCSLAGLLAVADAPAQGRHVNFEIMPVHPMAVATITIGSYDFEYLLVCNTPDNSLLVYSIDTVTGAELLPFARVPVGLRPVSVTWDPATHRFYTANFLGDSVTVGQFSSAGIHVIATFEVGDEPTDVAVVSNGAASSIWVTLQDPSALAVVHPGTFAVTSTPLKVPLYGASTMAMRHPRRILQHGNKVFALNQRGGNDKRVEGVLINGSTAYDLDLWGIDVTSPTQEQWMGSLGSTNWNMAAGPEAGTPRLYIVGAMAHNDLTGTALPGATTGFVTSNLYVVNLTTFASQGRDLNIDSTTSMPVTPTSNKSMSAPTDLALWGPTSSGQLTDVQKVFICGFSSDRVMELTVPPAQKDNPTSWPATHHTLTPHAMSASPIVGPRALMMKPASTAPVSMASRLYCLNALEQTITVFNPGTQSTAASNLMTIDVWGKNYDPVIAQGREFLYSAEHSGNKFVSCSSCHIDGTTDGLAWDLNALNTSAPPVLVKPELLEAGAINVIPQGDPASNVESFGTNKGLMITQSLQGLLNHPGLNGAMEQMVTNAPYHWRGDKDSVDEFNEAFVNLMGASMTGGTPEEPEHLSAEEAALMTSMINTIMYPPNPHQDDKREFTGDIGTPSDPTTWTGALRGMNLAHTTRLLGTPAGRSCVQCHMLPEFSNNRLTQRAATPPPPLPTGWDPNDFPPVLTESAGTRGSFARECALDRGKLDADFNVRTGQFGLTHSGINGRTVIEFIDNAFTGQLGSDTQSVIDFVRELDSGVAPMVGLAKTIYFDNAASFDAAFDAAVADMVTQVAEANIGLVVFVRYGSPPVEKAYFYDLAPPVGVAVPAGEPGVYSEEGQQTSLTSTQLKQLLTSSADRVIIQAVEVGSERDVASPLGMRTELITARPTDIELDPMVPATQWKYVHNLVDNWDPDPTSMTVQKFVWTGQYSTSPNPTPAEHPRSLLAMRVFQHVLFGADKLRHEAPRRFRVSGVGIRHGAKLRLRPFWLPNSITVEVKLFPTDDFTDGNRVWESTLEVDGLQTYMLMLGGPATPLIGVSAPNPTNVAEAMINPAAIPGVVPGGLGAATEAPNANIFWLGYNNWRVQVINEDDDGMGSKTSVEIVRPITIASRP